MNLIMTILWTTLSLSLAGGKDNGGDLIRATFFQRGTIIIDYLEENPIGKALVQAYQLDLSALENTLSADRVKLTDKALVDNGGSSVHALLDLAATPTVAYLNQTEWSAFLSKSINMDTLIFHEMLRLAGYNDDDNMISKRLRNLPSVRTLHLDDSDGLEVTAYLEIDPLLKVYAPKIKFSRGRNFFYSHCRAMGNTSREQSTVSFWCEETHESTGDREALSFKVIQEVSGAGYEVYVSGRYEPVPGPNYLTEQYKILTGAKQAPKKENPILVPLSVSHRNLSNHFFETTLTVQRALFRLLGFPMKGEYHVDNFRLSFADDVFEFDYGAQTVFKKLPNGRTSSNHLTGGKGRIELLRLDPTTKKVTPRDSDDIFDEVRKAVRNDNARRSCYWAPRELSQEQALECLTNHYYATVGEDGEGPHLVGVTQTPVGQKDLATLVQDVRSIRGERYTFKVADQAEKNLKEAIWVGAVMENHEDAPITYFALVPAQTGWVVQQILTFALFDAPSYAKVTGKSREPEVLTLHMPNWPLEYFEQEDEKP